MGLLPLLMCRLRFRVEVGDDYDFPGIDKVVKAALSFLLCSWCPLLPLFFCSVGSATTMVTEMLKAECDTKGIECEAAGTRLTEEESTLLALGIHADTGD